MQVSEELSNGIVSRRSPRSVRDTVSHLLSAALRRDLKIFAVIDHSGEAEQVGLEMRDTVLVIFGSPTAGTPVMVAAPLAALDLPLKALIWADDSGATWVSYNAVSFLEARHHLSHELVLRLAGIDAVVEAATAS